MASTCERSDQAAENRRNFPIISGVLDEFRAAFGADVKLINGTGNGKKIGKFRPVDKHVMSMKDWFKLSEYIAFEQQIKEQSKAKGKK